jgi:hypothetical protein
MMGYDNHDEEPNKFLRKCRNALGYGLGWKFIDALREWLVPKIIAVALLLIWGYVVLHTRICWTGFGE